MHTQTKLHTRTLLLASFALASLGWATTASAIIIDDFNDPPAGQSVSQTGVGSSNSFSAGGMLGGERDMSVGVGSSLTLTVNATANASGDGLYTQTIDESDQANGLVQWDGVDGSPGITSTGLGSIDFTAGGATAIALTISSNEDVFVTFSVFTNEPSGLEYSFLGQTIPAGPTTTVLFPYSSFNIGFITPADFTNIGAIMIAVFTDIEDTVVKIDLVQTNSLVPEPSSFVLAAAGLTSLGLLIRRRRS